MTRSGINDGSEARDAFSRCFPRVIQESSELEAFYPPLPHTDDIYATTKDRTRARAFKRLSVCMVDGSAYNVTKQEEIRAADHGRDVLGVFVVTITYIAHLDIQLK